MGRNNIAGKDKAAEAVKLNKLILLIGVVILYYISLPPVNFYIFAWVAFIPFFMIVLESPTIWKYGFFFGTAVGCSLFAFVIFIKIDEISFFHKVSLFFLIAILHGVVILLYVLIARNLQKRLKSIIIIDLLLALNWACAEYIANKILFGFSGYIIGLTQYQNPFIKPFISYFGMYGISFIVIFCNLQFYRIISMIRKNKMHLKLILGNIAPISILIFIIILSNILSKTDLNSKNTIGSIKIGLIQGNISKDEYSQASKYPAAKEKLFDKYLKLSQECILKYKSELIVWPESAVNAWLMRLSKYRDRILEFAKNNKVFMLIGTPDLEEDGSEKNSACVISPDGEICGKYDKNMLLPFAENNFLNGENSYPIQISSLNAGIRICYESVFPELTTSIVKKGANIMFYLSNHCDFGYSQFSYVNSAFTVFRAIENNIPVIQIINNGISQITLPDGSIPLKTTLYREELQCYDLTVRDKGITFYCNYGELMYNFIIFFLLSLFLVVNITPYLKHTKRKV